MGKNKKYIDLIKDGQPLQAVKEYKDDTNCSLTEAKEHIDMLVEKINARKKEKTKKKTKTGDERYIQLIEQGALLQAVQEYKEDTNCGLKEAKDYIDELAESLRPKYEDTDNFEDNLDFEPSYRPEDLVGDGDDDDPDFDMDEGLDSDEIAFLYGETEDLPDTEMDMDNEDYDDDTSDSSEPTYSEPSYSEESESNNLLENVPARRGCLIVVGIIILIWIIL